MAAKLLVVYNTGMLVYLAVDALFFITWLVLFVRRPDLRRKMLLLGVVMLPLGIFDYLSQPAYYHPPTFFSWPVGIEGMLYGFTVGGIGAALYDELAEKHLRKFRKRAPSLLLRLLVPVGVMACALLMYFAFHINMMLSLPLGLVLGFSLMAFVRPDLRKPILFSGLFFGVFYCLVLASWLVIFPQARGWWNPSMYAGVAILGVPFGEVLFGFLFGAFWGPIYEFMFDYKLR